MKASYEKEGQRLPIVSLKTPASLLNLEANLKYDSDSEQSLIKE